MKKGQLLVDRLTKFVFYYHGATITEHGRRAIVSFGISEGNDQITLKPSRLKVATAADIERNLEWQFRAITGKRVA